MSSAIQQLVEKYPELAVCQADIEQAVTLLEQCFVAGGKPLVCGNGGSGADSEHIVGELMKGFMAKRPLPAAVQARLIDLYGPEGTHLAARLQGGLPAISLTSQTALISAIANDTDASMVYAQQVYGYGKAGDALLAISTSGNSQNAIRALQVARLQGLVTIGLTGSAGGQMKGLCDVTIRVPYHTTPAVQERHLPIYHTLCLALEEAFFES